MVHTLCPGCFAQALVHGKRGENKSAPKPFISGTISVNISVNKWLSREHTTSAAKGAGAQSKTRDNLSLSNTQNAAATFVTVFPVLNQKKKMSVSYGQSVGGMC